MRIIVDTNVVLDVLLDRKPFANAAAGVFSLIEESKFEGMLCATTVTTIDYLLSQAFSRPKSLETLRRLLELFEIAPVNRPVIEEAFRSKITDFEDAVLEQAGRLAGADAIVTRNTRDFRNSAIKAIGPDELLSAFIE
ncbi:MAG TPA: PIN domain-containing protein [Kiritimatiellia bacterium]|nr:PIN domain-containing protein [Kiritimatiellia bacterium]HNS82057.1 PIN domain-containing protein [Kiritimatiellia bacterium]HPA79073.1 PIN domain-containing protein [Kiritimatiellia bacterium]HQQ05269.1 PIN domain-containing protein [Kiritimatiellia bacterium]